MNRKKFNLISLAVVLVVSVLAWYQGPPLKDQSIAKFNAFQKDRAVQEMVRCINKTGSITNIGYKDYGDSLTVFILYLPSIGTSEDTEKVLWGEAHRKLIKCALKVPDWETLGLYYIKPRSVLLLDKHEGYVPIVMLQVLFKRDTAEKLAVIDDFYAAVDAETESGDNGVELEDLSPFNFALDKTMLNGTPELASQRFDEFNRRLKIKETK